MGRLLAVDYGLKRSGIAVTDPLKLIANPLTMVPTSELMDFIGQYLAAEEVECIIVGKPLDLFQNETHSTKKVFGFVEALKRHFPQMRVEWHDERFTSKMAQRALISGGMRKSQRREKGNIDKVSAAIILQSYMEANP